MRLDTKLGTSADAITNARDGSHSPFVRVKKFSTLPCIQNKRENHPVSNRPTASPDSVLFGIMGQPA